MLARDDSFFVNKAVLAPLHANEAIDHIAQPNKVNMMDLAVKLEGYFSALNFEAFFEVVNQIQCASNQLQDAGD